MSLPTPDLLVKFNKFLAVENGRDKLNKIIQYGSRLLAYHLLASDPKSPWGKSFSQLFGLTRDCRKILRLFKFLGEYEKFAKFANQNPSVKRNLQMINAVGLAAYWYFDNLTYLVKGGMIQSKEHYARYSMLGWLVGIVSSLVLDTQTLLDSLESERKARQNLTGDQLKAALTTEYQTRINLYYNFPKNIGDLIISANGAGIVKNITGSDLNDGIIGLCGVVSGAAVCGSVWRGIK